MPGEEVSIQVFDGDGVEHSPRPPNPFPNKKATVRLRVIAKWLRQMQYALLSEVLLQLLTDDRRNLGKFELDSFYKSIIDTIRSNKCMKAFASERKWLKDLVEYRLSHLDSD